MLTLLLVHSLLAHDLYLMPQKFRPAKGETILLSTHTGDGFPVSDQPVDPARLTAIPSIPVDSWRMMNRATHATVTVKDGSQYFSVSTKPRFLEMEPAKFNDYLKAEGLSTHLGLRKQKNESSAPGREMYTKCAKTYIVAGAPTPGFNKPVGMKIEIVPLADPANLKPGDTLPLEVFYNGKPLADAQVELATASRIEPVGRTGPNGRLIIRIPDSGKVRLHTIAMERVSQPTHDWESFWASLTFEILANR